MACGRFAVPLPVGDTIAARYLFAQAGETPPPGPILFTSAQGEAAAAGALPVVRAQEIRINGDAPRLHFAALVRSEEHTSELQSLMRISYAVFCLKKKKKKNTKK